MHIFQFSHISASSALLHRSGFFLPGFKIWGNFITVIFKLPFQDDLFCSPEQTWTLIPAPLYVCIVTSNESFNLPNLYFCIWKMEAIILLTLHCSDNMICIK